MRASSILRAGAAALALAGVASVAATEACSSSSGPSGPPGLGQVAGTLAAAYCDALESCCGQRAFAYDRASCMAQKVHEFESVADVVKRGKVVYHAGAVEACAAALKARVSACSAEAGSGADAGQADPIDDACRPVFEGTVPPGQECTSGLECAIANGRETGSCRVDVRPGGDPKKTVCFKLLTRVLPGSECRTQAKTGAFETSLCDQRVAYCESAASPPPDDPSAGTCRELVPVGGSCAPTGTPPRTPQCAPPAFCDTTAGKCAAPPGVGQPCARAGTLCADGAWCDTAASPTGTCQPEKPNGEPCRRDVECAGGHCSLPAGPFDGGPIVGSCTDFGQSTSAVAFEITPRSCGFGPRGSGPEDAGIQPIKTASFRGALGAPAGEEGTR